MRVLMSKAGYMLEGEYCNVLVRPGSDQAQVITPAQWELATTDDDVIELEPRAGANALWDKRLEIQMVLHDEDLPVFTKWLRENVSLNDKMYNSVGGHDAGHGRRPGAMRLEDYMEQQILERVHKRYVSQWAADAAALAQDRLVSDVDWQELADEAVDKLLNLYADEVGERVVDEAVDRLVDEYAPSSDTICEDWTLDSLFELLRGDGIVDEVADEAFHDDLWPDMREVLI